MKILPKLLYLFLPYQYLRNSSGNGTNTFGVWLYLLLWEGYYISAQLRYLVCWCNPCNSAKWKNIEMTPSDIPIQIRFGQTAWRGRHIWQPESLEETGRETKTPAVQLLKALNLWLLIHFVRFMVWRNRISLDTCSFVTIWKKTAVHMEIFQLLKFSSMHTTLEIAKPLWVNYQSLINIKKD